MSYRVTDGHDRVVADVSARQHWYVLDSARLAQEVAEPGLRVSAGPAGLHLIHR